jgi:hypothetical protein
MEQRVGEIVSEFSQKGVISLTSFSAFMEIKGTIPLEKFMQLISALTREDLTMNIRRSSTVLPPGQNRLERTSHRDPYVEFEIAINKPT